jgi:hypothetical protein
MVVGALAVGLVQRVIWHVLLFAELSSQPRQIEAAAFFARETPMNSDILKFSPRADCRAHDPEKCRVMPIGYARLGICLRGSAI